MSPKTDENFCPFCGKPNFCEISADKACWCGKIAISEELIAALPVSGKACICLRCINAFHENPQEFLYHHPVRLPQI
jgi:hypothetical protein